MLEQLDMEVTSRDERGKNAARRLRAAGRVPATLYGMGQDPLALAMDTKAITGMLSQRTHRNCRAAGRRAHRRSTITSTTSSPSRESAYAHDTTDRARE